MRQPAFQQALPVLARRAPSLGLLLALGLHLLLAYSWRIAHPPVSEHQEERVFQLIPLPLPPPVRSAPPLERAPTLARSSPSASSAPAPVRPREPEAITVPLDAPGPAADPFAEPPPAQAPQSAPDTMAGRARREAGAIDRALRKGKSGVPSEPDTPMGRFVRGVQGAYIDRSRTLMTDSFTAPDGEVIYRFRQGGKVWCRISGSVRPPSPAAGNGGFSSTESAGGGGFAGAIPCPASGDFKRD